MREDRGDFLALGKGVVIQPLAKVIHKDSVVIGDYVMIDDFAFIMGGEASVIGSYVHFSSFSSVTGGGSFYAEDFTGFAPGCRILTGTDDFTGGSLTNSTIPEEFRGVERSFVRICRHAVVGANATVLPGVTVGEGAVVGACSVVTRDIDPWTISWGIPARPMKKRRSEMILELGARLLERD